MPGPITRTTAHRRPRCIRSPSGCQAFAPEVSVNCVAPGWIALEAEEIERGTGQAAHFAARPPCNATAAWTSVAQAVLFFAAGPHFITGQVLAVDGGLGYRRSPST